MAMDTASHLVWLALAAGAPWALPLTARAATAADDGPAVMAELVPDSELAQARGKFLGSNLVSGFMVEMVSRWQNDSAIATATARVEAANLAAANAMAQATANLSARIQSLDTRQVAGNGGTASSNLQVGGVGQVAQIAGDGNAALNIGTISTQTAPMATQSGSNAAAQTAQGNGMVANATVTPGGGVSVGIQSAAGNASQIAQAGSLMQVARITGDAQQVVNLTNITLQLQQMTIRQLTQSGMRDALASMASIRR